MGTVIYKYELGTITWQQLAMPSGAKPLAVMVQNGTPCLWAMVDPDNPPASFAVTIAPTGFQVNSESPEDYCGSFMLYDGDFVGHVFVKEPQ